MNPRRPLSRATLAGQLQVRQEGIPGVVVQQIERPVGRIEVDPKEIVLKAVEWHSLELLDGRPELVPLITVVGKVPRKVRQVWRNTGDGEVEHDAVERFALHCGDVGFKEGLVWLAPAPFDQSGTAGHHDGEDQK